MTDTILLLTTQTSWSTAQKAGVFTAESLTGEGFIHCSKVDQILRVANTFFEGQHGLVILVIDPDRVTSEIRWEPGTDLATDLFPHIYGPINLDAVVHVLEFEPGADGKFHLPKSLEFAES